MKGFDKNREEAKKAAIKKWIGCLPKNLINDLLLKQEGKCALSSCDNILSVNYKLDHIIPLLIEGKHVAENIQLLCESCYEIKKQELLLTYSKYVEEEIKK